MRTTSFKHAFQRIEPFVTGKNLVKVLLGGAILTIVFVLLASSHAPFSAPIERSASRVQVLPLEKTTEPIIVSGYGTAEPSKTLELTSQLSGNVIHLHPQFQEGGIIAAGECMVLIDPRDFEIQVDARKADVVRAESDFKQELGNQEVAKHEWEMFARDGVVEKGNHELALRLPMIKDKEAALQAAKSQLRKAELDLQRAAILAPFPALVVTKHVEEGSYVTQSLPFATLASTDRFFIKVRVPDESLRWISIEHGSDVEFSKNEVRIFQQGQDGHENVRTGSLERLLGSVEATGRMVQFLVSVPDPLSTADNRLPLLLGSYVRVEIRGRDVPEVYKIPRKYIREQNTALVADATQKLRIRTLDVVYARDDFVLVRSGFRDGDRLITSTLASPLVGVKLEIESEKGAP